MDASVFVQCRSCRTQVEFGVPVCPTCGGDPEGVAAAAPTFTLAAPDRIGDHLFFPGDVFCSHCGTHMAEAHSRRCGRA